MYTLTHARVHTQSEQPTDEGKDQHWYPTAMEAKTQLGSRSEEMRTFLFKFGFVSRYLLSVLNLEMTASKARVANLGIKGFIPKPLRNVAPHPTFQSISPGMPRRVRIKLVVMVVKLGKDAHLFTFMITPVTFEDYPLIANCIAACLQLGVQAADAGHASLWGASEECSYSMGR